MDAPPMIVPIGYVVSYIFGCCSAMLLPILMHWLEGNASKQEW